MDNQCQLNPHHFTLQQECFLNWYPTQTQSCFHKWIHFRLKCGVLVLLGVINKCIKIHETLHDDILPTWSTFDSSLSLWFLFVFTVSLLEQSSSQDDFLKFTISPSLLLITCLPLPDLVPSHIPLFLHLQSFLLTLSGPINVIMSIPLENGCFLTQLLPELLGHLPSDP